ncbi:MAG: hypothetical protein ACPL3E_01305 [Minisyncoccia bacterium]
MRLVILTIIFIFLCFVIYEVYIYFNKFQEKKAEYAEISNKLNDIKQNFGNLKLELNYYNKVENLIKEFKKQFNYKLPFEKLMILIPQNSAPTQNATNTKNQ